MSAVHPWDAVLGVGSHREGPRKANADEVSAYIAWLADKRGCSIDDVEMPALAHGDVVTVEELDEAGNVIRSSRIGLNNGKLPWNAAKVRSIVGKVAKPAAQPKAKKPAICQPVQPEPSTAVVEMETPMIDPTTTTARLDALEAMIRDLCTVLAAPAGAAAPLPAPDALVAAPTVETPCEAPAEDFGYLSLIGEPAPAPAAQATVNWLQDGWQADHEAQAARIARLEAALARAHAGRRRAVRALHAEKGRVIMAMADARRADIDGLAQRERADAAEKMVAQVQPLLDMLDQVRPNPGGAADDGFCKPARGNARWPVKGSAAA